MDGAPPVSAAGCSINAMAEHDSRRHRHGLRPRADERSRAHDSSWDRFERALGWRRALSEVQRHLQHRRSKPERRREPLCRFVLYHGREYDNGCAQLLELGDDRSNERTGDAVAPLGIDDVDVVHGAVSIQEYAPITFFEGAVAVADDGTVTFGDHDDGLWALYFRPQPPRVTLLDVREQKEARRVHGVMVPHDFCAEERGAIDVFEGGRANAETGLHRAVLPARDRLCRHARGFARQMGNFDKGRGKRHVREPPMPIEDLLGLTIPATVRELLPRGAYLEPIVEATRAEPLSVLLPRRELPDRVAVGDRLEVFLYLDSEDRPIATTTPPALELGQVTFLTVTDLTQFGAFVDWQLPKELLVPFAEQIREPRIGERHPIGLIRDKSGRLAGTMRVSEMLRKKPRCTIESWVEGEAWRNEPDLGVFVIVEKSCVGLLPATEPHRLQRGQRERFRVTNILSDGKIELSLRRHVFEELADDAERLLAALRKPECPKLGDQSSPERIRDCVGLSKKAFKRAAGRLLKQGRVDFDSDGYIRLK